MPFEPLEKALAKQKQRPLLQRRHTAEENAPRVVLPSFGYSAPGDLRTNRIHFAEFEAAAEDQPYPFGFLLDGGNFAVVHLISKGEGTADPETLSFGGSNLVPDLFGGNLAFELGKTLSVRRPMEVELLC